MKSPSVQMLPGDRVWRIFVQICRGDENTEDARDFKAREMVTLKPVSSSKKRTAAMRDKRVSPRNLTAQKMVAPKAMMLKIMTAAKRQKRAT